jgi:tetratricopeptide (TPR) repeat protein
MSRIRGALGSATGDDEPARLVVRGEGYLLEVRPDSVDLHRFGRLVHEARAIREPDLRSARLAAALDLWRGPALADAVTGAGRDRLCGALEELRYTAIADRADAELDAGRHANLVATLSTLADEHPLRERIHGQLMIALYRCGRRADALAVYRRARRLLVAELGLEPGPQLRAIHASILTDTIRHGTGTGQDAPSTAAPEVPAQLPPDVAGFVGRTAYLRQLDAMLTTGPGPTTPRIWVISGGAGVGKTTLAVHWAHRVREGFPDGQLYLNLRGFDPVGPPVSPAEALPVLLQMLHVRPTRIPTMVDAQVGLYRSVLARRRVLIVLDNVRDAGQVQPLLPGAPGCAAVITSRNELTSLLVEGAHPLPLALLTTEDARELLVRRLGAARVAAEPDAVDDIITGCARLPLALAIVAARAATHPGFALAALAGEAHGPGGGLDAFDGGDHTIRVRTVFSWSYLALTPDAARLFRLLGLHPGPDITAPAAASLAGTAPAQTRPLLAELARAHLVTEHTPGRYTFHDLLRAYAAELAHTHDDEPARRAATHRLLDHYLHTAHVAHHLMRPHRDPIPISPPQPGVTPENPTNHAQALAWFTTEHTSLVAVAAHAAKTGFETHTWQLALTLDEFFYRRGHGHDWATTHRNALDAARRQSDRPGQAHIHRSLAVAHARQGRHDDAQAHFQQALDLFIALDDHTSQALTHLGIAWLHSHQDRHPKALDHARQALDLYHATGNRIGQANALNSVGWYHAQLGDHDQTLIHCAHALTLLQDAGDHWVEEAGAWDSLGYAHHHLGHHQQAITCYEHAVDLYRRIGDRYNEADSLTHLGDTHDATGNHRAARDSWHQAAAILAELDHPDADQVRAKLGSADAG